MFVPMMISNMAAGNVSIQLGFKGKCTNVVTACASGLVHGDALRAIQYGDAVMMLAGGTESSICATGVAGFMNLTALSTETDPMRASIPFDQDRSGFVLGEGAGVVMLEELNHAKRAWRENLCGALWLRSDRRCVPYHIAGGGRSRCSSCDAACNAGGVCHPRWTISMHMEQDTSRRSPPVFETRAIHLAFGDAAHQLHINSTKSMIGHLLGGAGGVEMVATVLAIRDGWIHPTVRDEKTDRNVILIIRLVRRADGINYAANSLGFGGHNASLLLKRYKNEKKEHQVGENGIWIQKI